MSRTTDAYLDKQNEQQEAFNDYLDALKKLNDKLDLIEPINHNLVIANNLMVKLIDKLDPLNDEKILLDAYMKCHNITDFKSRARKYKNFDSETLIDWYNEQQAKFI